MIQTKFVVNGNDINIVRLSDSTALDVLPPKVYSVKYDQMRGYYLTVLHERFHTPKKIYGTVDRRVDKCINTYLDRPGSIGVLMTGDKGTGKTVTLSVLVNKVIDDLEMPAVMVGEAFHGSDFDQFIQSIGECCLVFDEFGKIYGSTRHEDKPNQDRLLTLFDGADKMKRMIVLTENEEFHISEFMLNRPGRIYYHFRYPKLDEESIVDYCIDHGVSDDARREILDLSRRSKLFSFDMLQTIVEEHLRYEEPISDTITDLNINIRKEELDQIEIVRVLDKRNNTEVPLSVSQHKIVEKPIGSYDSTPIKLDIGSKVTPDGDDVLIGATMQQLAEALETTEESEDVTEYIYISQKDVAYQSAGNIVYETQRFTIIAKDVPKTTVSYFNMF